MQLWIWLLLTLILYFAYKLWKYFMFQYKLHCVLSEYKEGSMGDSYLYTWEYKKSKGNYSVYGYEPYCIRLKYDVKENLSKSNTFICGHDVPEDTLKRFIQLNIVCMMNKKLQPTIFPTLEYLNYTQDSSKHGIIH